jgi:hypothetical protein
MVKVISVSDLYFRGKPILVDGGCDGIPCSDLDKFDTVEPTDNELFEIQTRQKRERKEKEAKLEGADLSSLKSSFQNSLITSTFKIQ